VLILIDLRHRLEAKENFPGERPIGKSYQLYANFTYYKVTRGSQTAASDPLHRLLMALPSWDQGCGIEFSDTQILSLP
jgi:hypothetical protein